MIQNGYKSGHAETLQRALVRMCLLNENEKLPSPYNHDSGVAGKSDVYFVFLPRNHSGINLVAKFDVPERSKKEWEAIGKLKKLNVSPEALLPYEQNIPDDEVIIYRDVSSITPHNNVWQFSNLLENQLISNIENCKNALEMAIKSLGYFYRGTIKPHSNQEMIKWESQYLWLKEPGNLQNIENNVRRFVWNLNAEIGLNQLPNPISEVTNILKELTGSVIVVGSNQCRLVS